MFLMRKRASGFDKKCLFNNFRLLRIKLFLLLGLKKNKIRLKKFCQNHRPIVNYRPNIMISTDEAKRQELYKFVLTRLHDDAVYIPLTYECNKAIYRSDLKGMHFMQTQYEVPFQDMYIE